ncbi:MAG: hypothetical protein IT207_07525 [Fimbriimonadaceae bacterium]|nr:hypothetical protein [Fimbriimonadaceae bacterium]
MAIALIVTVILLWPKEPRYPPIVQAGLRLIECEHQADADCTYEYITDDERRLYGLTRESWRWFIQDYGRDIRWAKTVSGGKVQFYGSEANGIVRVSRPSIDGYGKLGASGVAMARTDKGYQAPRYATSLIIGIPTYKGRTRDIEQSEWRAAKLEAFERDGALLAAHGFKGYPIEGEFLTWDDHVARLRGLLNLGPLHMDR